MPVREAGIFSLARNTATFGGRKTTHLRPVQSDRQEHRQPLQTWRVQPRRQLLLAAQVKQMLRVKYRGISTAPNCHSTATKPKNAR